MKIMVDGRDINDIISEVKYLKKTVKRAEVILENQRNEIKLKDKMIKELQTQINNPSHIECKVNKEPKKNSKKVWLKKLENHEYGWYAYVEGKILVIGDNYPHEGGELYRGPYLGNETPYLKTISCEDTSLYYQIIDHFEKEVNKHGI